ncbi:hypothetical protein Ahy_A09g042598 [Arachis hypogaea]|uniref:Uncharacterized protein n=1 Tax=Arachis hypogaea TaxID=3818 RepID=A0A445BGE4_ARAHY|nr:hypothetical protein Ahy_A09g042598 [Arachis hypogaea]
MFKVYEVEFHPIFDEKLWLEWHGAHLRPNLARRRKGTGRPNSMRFCSDMDEVERQEKRHRLFRQTSILCLLLGLNVQPLHAGSDALWSRNYNSSGVPPTPLPPGRSPSVWLHLPGMPTMIRDISWKVEDIPRLTWCRLQVVREGQKFGVIKHILSGQMSDLAGLLVPDRVLLRRPITNGWLNGDHMTLLKPSFETIK